jgi:TP901 family phage tail tape measure protein
MSNNIQRTEVITTMNNSQAVDKLKELRGEAAKYCEAMIQAKSAGDKISYNNMLKQLNQVNAEIRQMQRNAVNINEVMSNLSTAKPKELQRTIRAINTELNSGRVERGSKEWDEYTMKLRKCDAELKAVKADMKASGTGGNFFTKISDGFNRYSAAAAGAVASFTGIAYTAKKCVDNFAEMDEAMTEVMKYTNMTKDQVKDLNEDFKKIDTRTSREQLNELAGDAGRLGITSKQGIEDFVDAADKINVALGEDLGPDAVKNIGRMAMMFGEDKTKGLRGAMLATGSAVNELSQDVGADANYLTDFTARVAGAANQARISQADILGYAGVLNRNMQAVEMAGTAFQTLLMKMYQDPAKFAKLAGKNVKDFTNLLKNDANEALLQFLQSMKDKGGFAELAPMFKEMGLDGVRASGVLSTLAVKLSDVRKQQEISNKAYSAGTSVITEFNTENTTVQAGFDKAKKRIKDISIELGEKLQPIMTNMIHTTSDIIKVMNTVMTFIPKHIMLITSLTAIILTYTLGAKALTVVQNLLTKAFDLSKAAASGLWNSIKSNPVGALVSVLILAVSAWDDFKKSEDEATKRQQELNNVQKQAKIETDNEINGIHNLLGVARDQKKSLDERSEALRQLKEKYPEYLGSLNLEAVNSIKAAQAEKILTRQILLRAEAEDIAEKRKELAEKKLKLLTDPDSKPDNSSWLDSINLHIATAIHNAEDAFGYRSLDLGFLSRWADYTDEDLDKKWKNTFASLNSQINAQDEKLKKNAEEQTKNLASISKMGTGISGSSSGGKGTTPATKKKKHKGKSAETLERERENKEVKAAEAKYDKLKAMATANYSAGIIDKQKYDDEIEQLDIKMLGAKMGAYKKNSEEYNKLLLEKVNKLRDAQDKMHERSVQEDEQKTKDTRKIYLDSYINGETDLKSFEENVHQLEYDDLKRKRDIYAKGTKEYTDYQKQMDEWSYNDRLEKQKSFDDKVKEIQEDSTKKSNSEVEADTIAFFDKLHKEGIGSEEAYQKIIAAIRHKYAVKAGEDVNYGGNATETNNKATDIYNEAKGKTGNQDHPETDNIFDTMFGNDAKLHTGVIKNLQKMEKSDKISHAEYLAAKAQADEDYYKTLEQKASMAYNQIGALISSYSDYVSACSDAEVAKVTKKYEIQIKAAGESTTKGKALEEKKEADIAKIKSKYNKRKTKIQIAQALAETAISALNAYNAGWEAGWPAGEVLAPLFAGIAVASGMLQVATIKKQAAAQDDGYYSGGFTDGNNYHKVAGSVHEGEFVANHQAVNNPNVLPVLQMIDRAQRNNTVGSLTSTDVTRVLNTKPSSADVSMYPDNDSAAAIAVISASLDKQAAVINRLSKLLDSGIQSYVIMDGEKGLDKQYTHYKKLQSNKSR